MALASPDAVDVAPWTQRIAETPPWTPLRLALAIGFGVGAVFLGVEAALGRLALMAGAATHPRGDFRVALVMIVLLAYLPAAFTSAARGTRRTVAELAPALTCTPAELAALREQAGRFEPLALRRAGLIGAALMLAIPLATNLDLDTWAVWKLPVEAIFHRLLLPLLGWFTGRFVYALMVESRRLSRLGRERLRVDLLDLPALAPLARQGLRQAGLTVGLVSILAFALFDRDIAPALPVVLAVGLAATLAIAATALLLPARGARDAIVAAKRADLEACTAQIRAARAGKPTLDRRTLADLLAWRGYVAALPDWPFDTPTLLRFAAYLAIPLGSWLGGALVERAVEVALR